ncbi:uridine-cytidine kinase-like 1 isoform X2 [Oppia nitens]|uniref:uridine-cytidine kinase-like 1 isoform X2 n=1 Tax=Oppia nitens TaxID=1686743 RepID=UPI0023DA6712|nr:uridine-cytidine kinase-like 1 isoform X2 [Oppia nitens]
MADCVVFKDAPSSASSDGGSSDDLCYEIGIPYNRQESVATDSPESPQSPASPRIGQRVKRERTLSMSKSAKSATKTDTVLRTRQRTIYTSGRPPWYDTQGQPNESFVIGICGGSASGKTTVAQKIIEALDVPWVTLLCLDSFYKVLNEEQHRLAHNNEYNFDHPDAFDFDLMNETLRKLKEGKRVEVPIYNFVTHSREKVTKIMYGANVIVCDGILLFANKTLVDMMDMKVFIDTDSDIRLARRMRRDITERGRDLEGVIKQYNQFVKPMFDYYIAPSMIHADLIVPRGGENQVAIDLIVQHVHTQLQSKGLKLRSKLIKIHCDQPLPKSLRLLPPTSQIRGMHTFIRKRETSRDEFIFYSKRLMRLLIEFTLSLLPFKEVIVETPQNISYHGKRIDCQKICGVSILRAGETMEQSLCEVIKDVRIGKILIQTNRDTDEPELYYLRLPKDIKDYKIMLMDATVASGAAAMMAIRVLLDHDVPEDNIYLLSLLMAVSGVHSIAYAFPNVKVITTEVDPEVSDKFYILPGIGNYGDRFYGTEASTDY